MKTITEKIAECLKDKKEAFIGNMKNRITKANAEGFKEGLLWAIDTIETLSEKAEFEETAREVMKYLAQKHHPHTSVIITSTRAELVEGVKATKETFEYVPD